ncbi:MAG: DUF4340 domain-containing protein [Brevinematales bacterium]|nr:DUF4340 domain-containing protein [Brevinematales bacterium]
MKKSQQKLVINLVLLFGALLILGGFYLFFVQPSNLKKKDWGKVLLLSGVTKSDISALDIMFTQLSNTFGVALTRLSNGWNVSHPYKTLAYSAEVEKLIDDLMAAKSDDMLTNVTPDQIREFGFDQPIDVIDVYLANGKKVNIINGGFAPVDNYYYTMLNHDSNNIYIVYAYMFSSSERYADIYIQRNIFSLKATAVTNITIKAMDGKEYRLGYTANQWTLYQPKKMDVDNYAVQRKILEFTALPLVQFAAYERTPELIKQYGLDKPKYLVKMVSSLPEDGTKWVYISGMTNGNMHYAYTPSLPGIIYINHADLLSKFILTPETFLIPVNPETNVNTNKLEILQVQ